MGINGFVVVPGKREGHGIDGEIAAGEIVVDVAGLHVGERAGLTIGLLASSDQVDGGALNHDGRGSEALVYREASTHGVRETRGQGRSIAHHGHVEVFDREAQEVVADGPADEVGGGPGFAGQRLNFYEQAGQLGISVQKNTDGRCVGSHRHYVFESGHQGRQSLANATRPDKPGGMFG